MEFLMYIWWLIKFSVLLVITVLLGLATGAVLSGILGLMIIITREIDDFIKTKRRKKVKKNENIYKV